MSDVSKEQVKRWEEAQRENHEKAQRPRAKVDSTSLHAKTSREAKPPSEMTDAELNAAVATEVMGWEYTMRLDTREFVPVVGGVACAPWSPATDIAAAMNDVVPEMRKRGYRYFELCCSSDEEWYAHFRRRTTDRVPGRSGRAIHANPARAICEAALAAAKARPGGCEVSS